MTARYNNQTKYSQHIANDRTPSLRANNDQYSRQRGKRSPSSQMFDYDSAEPELDQII